VGTRAVKGKGGKQFRVHPGGSAERYRILGTRDTWDIRVGIPGILEQEYQHIRVGVPAHSSRDTRDIRVGIPAHQSMLPGISLSGYQGYQSWDTRDIRIGIPGILEQEYQHIR